MILDLGSSSSLPSFVFLCVKNRNIACFSRLFIFSFFFLRSRTIVGFVLISFSLYYSIFILGFIALAFFLACIPIIIFFFCVLLILIMFILTKVKKEFETLFFSFKLNGKCEIFECSLYDQIFKPSKLPANADFHLFKAGIEPKWEDPECAAGGKWSITSNRKAGLDTMWLETVNILTVLVFFFLWIFECWVFLEYNLWAFVLITRFLFIYWTDDGFDWRAIR